MDIIQNSRDKELEQSVGSGEIIVVSCYLQISFPMVLPSSLLAFLRLGSLRVRVVVNFLNCKSQG